MSALQWRDWSCTVRVVLADGRPATAPPAPAVAQQAERLVRDLMQDVSRSVSRFRDDSDLARVDAAAGRLVPVRRLTLELVDVALGAARDTEGACDPTVGAALTAAGYDADIDVVRARSERGTRPGDPVGLPPTTRADWTRVRVDRDLGRLGVPRGLGLDLGATAKAWTADRAAASLSRGLGMPALVAIGGDLAVSSPAGRPGPAWPVTVGEHEGDAVGAHGADLVELAHGGLATSSVAGRRWRTPSGERHHLIDPRSGRPTTGPVRTVSVLAATCVRANTLSTAALVWGSNAADRLRTERARFVDADGQVSTTAGWPRRVVAA